CSNAASRSSSSAWARHLSPASRQMPLQSYISHVSQSTFTEPAIDAPPKCPHLAAKPIVSTTSRSPTTVTLPGAWRGPCCCDNFLYGFKGTPSGRASRPALAGLGAETRRSSRELRNSGGVLPDAWGGQKPPPFGGGTRGGGPRPRVGSPRTRRQTVPAVTHPHDPACARSWPSRPPRAGHFLTGKNHRSRALAALASLARWRCAPPLTMIFPGKTSAPTRRTGDSTAVTQ